LASILCEISIARASVQVINFFSHSFLTLISSVGNYCEPRTEKID
jgi:hypothetical protein